MTSKVEITPRAVAELRRVFHQPHVNGPESKYRAALAAALPFCKLVDNDARLHLFDGRFTLPLVVKSYPGVSFIHPADAESAPVCVITCDDHPTIAAGIVDAIKAAHDAHVVRGGAPHCLCGDNDGKWCSLPGCPYEKPTNVEIKNGAAFMRANGEAMKTIRAACGSSLDKSWSEKARDIFGDQKKSTLLVIGAALAKIAEALPGRVHIEVGYPDEVKRSPAAETRAAILRDDPNLLDELHKLAGSIGAVFIPYENAATSFLATYSQIAGKGSNPMEYADISHMSGHNDEGVPLHGAYAMRQGWPMKANPWTRKDGGLCWWAELWTAQWIFENAQCMKSFVEGSAFKPLPPVMGVVG